MPITTDGHATALQGLVAEARREEASRQGELFAEPRSEPETRGQVVPFRGPGRPPGARNKRTDEAARLYCAAFGDPLARAIEVAAMPILAPGVLEEFARFLQCSRLEAFKAWANCSSATMPFVHQRLATLEVKPAGSPGGEALVFGFVEDDAGELIEQRKAENG